MPDYILAGKKISLRPADVVGKGGEADIFKKGTGAYKVFKRPDHPDLSGDAAGQIAARERIAEHQKKLSAYPSGLPTEVLVPKDLLYDLNGQVAGYHMNFLEDCEVLFRYGERNFRDQGVSDETVIAVMSSLYRTVAALHQKQVVVGDFNDLNVLVKERIAYLIDTDSMQFAGFLARMFTAKFVDPLICSPAGSTLTMVRPHSEETDWYAYLIMLMQVLLYVGPYGGVYRPADKAKNIPHDARPLKRITVFNSEVRYPRPARPYKILPDDLLHHLELVFEKDKRGVPPLHMIEGMRFTTCQKCGVVHARGVCPDCVGVTPPMVKEVITGKVTAIKVFDGDARILYATMQNGTLRYIYHQNGEYRREGGKTIVAAPLDPNIRFRVHGDKTLLARGRQCFVFENGARDRQSISVDSFGMLPLVDANGENIFFAQGSTLMKIGALGMDYPERVGDILENQTLFWVGDHLGFGFYRAAELSGFFLFRPKFKGINDSVRLPSIRGQLVDSTCVFAENRVWFFTSTQENTKAVNRCHVVDERGQLIASAEGSPGDGSWLSTIRGKCAANGFLLAPTDDGVVQVAPSNGVLAVAKEFPDTQRFVDAGSHLFLSREGLFVTRRYDIWRLVVS